VDLLRCAGQDERIKHLLGHGVQHAGEILAFWSIRGSCPRIWTI
jgi:hypothetical protein